MGYHPSDAGAGRRLIKTCCNRLDKLDLSNYITYINNEVKQWHRRSLQRKTKSLQSKWVSAFTRGAGNEADSSHLVGGTRSVVSTYYVSVCNHRFNLLGKGGSEMNKYMLYLKNEKGEYEPTAIGYFKELIPLAFGHIARFECLGK